MFELCDSDFYSTEWGPSGDPRFWFYMTHNFHVGTSNAYDTKK